MIDCMKRCRKTKGSRGWAPRILFIFLACTHLAKQTSAPLSLAAWGVILAVLGPITTVAAVLTTSDTIPKSAPSAFALTLFFQGMGKEPPPVA